MWWRLHELWSRLRGTVGGGAGEAEIDEELRFHLDMAAERNIARGMTPAEARRIALLQFGGVDRTREAARDVQRSRWLEDVGQDVRYSVRALLRTPAFALAAILTLALGIGANTAIFSVLEAVVLRPLPYAQPSGLVAFSPERYETYQAWTGRAGSLASAGAYTYSITNVSSGAEPARVWTLAVTSSLLPTLGVTPFLGRNFSAQDDRPGAPPRVLLRYGFWQTHFGGDAALVGRTVSLSGAPFEVIGILPRELEFPPPARREDGSMPLLADLWTGVGRLPDLHQRGGFHTIGRLLPGSSAERVSAELSAFANEAIVPRPPQPVRIDVQRVSDSVVAPLLPAVLAFTAAVGLVLLIACANLGSLLLARLAGRQRELALRISLGARPGRIMRQILTEGSVLASSGALAGVGLAWFLLRVLLELAPPELARVQQASLSPRVLAFTLVLAMVTAVLIGVIPALRVLRRDPRAALGSTRGHTVDRITSRMHALLVTAEVAFAVVLLVGGGLLLRSFSALATVSPGFQADGLVTADLLIPPDRYQDRTAVLQFFDRLETQLAAQPGVRGVSAIDRLPYGPSWSGLSFQIIGRTLAPGAAQPRGSNAAARPGYFRTMGIPIVQGREILASNATGAAPVVVIGKALADRYWPNVSPVGERIRVFGVERQIVGVAGDVRHRGPTTPVDPMVYLPQSQDITTRRMMTVVVRTDGNPNAMLGTVRNVIRALDPQQPISNLRSFGALRSQRTASERFNALLVASFAALAVLLAAVGIYGAGSFVVAQRTREIGVRMALGASRASVLREFLLRALRAAAIGSVAGLGAALALTRLMQGMLFGVPATNVMTYAVVLLLVSSLALLAGWLPAWRAAAVQPSTALLGD